MAKRVPHRRYPLGIQSATLHLSSKIFHSEKGINQYIEILKESENTSLQSSIHTYIPPLARVSY